MGIQRRAVGRDGETTRGLPAHQWPFQSALVKIIAQLVDGAP